MKNPTSKISCYSPFKGGSAMRSFIHGFFLSHCPFRLTFSLTVSSLLKIGALFLFFSSFSDFLPLPQSADFPIKGQSIKSDSISHIPIRSSHMYMYIYVLYFLLQLPYRYIYFTTSLQLRYKCCLLWCVYVFSSPILVCFYHLPIGPVCKYVVYFLCRYLSTYALYVLHTSIQFPYICSLLSSIAHLLYIHTTH